MNTTQIALWALIVSAATLLVYVGQLTVLILVYFRVIKETNRNARERQAAIDKAGEMMQAQGEATKQGLMGIAERNTIGFAIMGACVAGLWLISAKTQQVYRDTINQYRGELHRIGHDLDSDIRTLAMVAQHFASFSRRREQASKSTRNLRLAILSSFYEYALARYLLAPMDDQGHIANPLKIVSREKIEPYQGIHWLEPEEAEAALHKIDRATLLGKRDYALLVVLLNTGRRLKEVASLE